MNPHFEYPEQILNGLPNVHKINDTGIFKLGDFLLMLIRDVNPDYYLYSVELTDEQGNGIKTIASNGGFKTLLQAKIEMIKQVKKVINA